ncbi:MAG: efflux RND transporter periplasmic adaptor subunit [Phycisphaerales bacterium]|nr:efflux RND transporter periplasmic adaptor subunit [Phycisphaerales bacterium]
MLEAPNLPRLRTSPRRAGFRASAILALSALALAGACKRSSEANVYAPPPPPEVLVANPVEREVTTFLTYPGVIEASESVELRARVQGFLESIHFEPGQRVNVGDLLFVIDKRQYQASVDQAAASLEAQKATLLGAENDARLARELADQRAGPEIDAVIKAARRDTAKAEVELAEARLADARLSLEFCEVRAPIAGRISRNFVDTGNLVGRSEPTLLAQIVQATPSFVTLAVSESDVLAVRRERERIGEDQHLEPGQISPGVWRPCELALTGQQGFATKGRVDYVDPQLDTATATLQVRTRFENENETLIPGLFARVRFPMSSRRALLAPEAALLTDQQGRYALVVNDEGTVESRRVRVGTLEGSMRVIEEGLKPTDRVVVVGVLKARPGSKVTPKPAEPPASAQSAAPGR